MRWAALLFLVLLPAIRSNAAEITVQSTLSRTTATVGTSVQLQIAIDGTQAVSPPVLPPIPGLEFRLAGTNKQARVINFKPSASISFTYQVRCLQEGEFVIPGFTLTAEGRTVQTQPLNLSVVAAGSPVSPTQPRAAGEETRPFFARLVVPKTAAYVGEMLPVEIRFYYASGVRVQPEQPPIFSGDGYTALKLGEPEVKEEMVGGALYTVVTYRTAIAGATPGPLELGPATQNVLLQMRRQQRNRFPSLGEDPFEDDIFSRLPGGFSETIRENIATDKVNLTIQPLPESGRPPEFAGAVGQFALSASANPRSGSVGDPLSVTFEIRGQGNFDRVSAPVVTEDPDWRSYAPSENFAPTSATGLDGVKTFEQVFVPKGPTRSLPAARFVYFDPVAERFVTLDAPPFPVEITGTAAATPTPPRRVEPEPSPDATAEAKQATDLVLTLERNPGPWTGPFISPIETRIWQIAAGIPAVLLLGFGIIGTLQRSRAKNASRLAADRNRKQLLHTIRTSKDPTEALGALRALVLHIAPDGWESAVPEEADRHRFQSLLNRADEIHYAQSTGSASLSEEDRAFGLKIVRLLDGK